MNDSDESFSKITKKGYSSHKLKSSKTTTNLQDVSSELDDTKPKPRSKSEYGKLRSRSQPQLASVPISKIFIEVEDGFKRINPNTLKSKVPKEKEVETVSTHSKDNCFKNLAHRSQTYFHQIGTLCHGLLAGIALWHCVAIFNLSPPFNSWADFLHHYSNLAHGYQALFYFLNVICVVSVYERFDIASKGLETFLSLYREKKLAILALFFYPLSLIITISVTNIDDMIQSHKHANKTAWWEDMSDSGVNVDEKLDLWRWLSLVRGITVVFGWLLIGIQSDKDEFLETLKENS